jgi:hypothetical protein
LGFAARREVDFGHSKFGGRVAWRRRLNVFDLLARRSIYRRDDRALKALDPLAAAERDILASLE